MRVDEYRCHDLTGLAGLITSGEVTPGELHETARTALEDVEPELNAIADGPWDRLGRTTPPAGSGAHPSS